MKTPALPDGLLASAFVAGSELRAMFNEWAESLNNGHDVFEAADELRNELLEAFNRDA